LPSSEACRYKLKLVAAVLVILLNTYREAVRARVLHGLFALAVGTAMYAVVVGQYASKNALRAISDIGSFGVSFYGVVVAIVLGATSLYRELELKTVYPILARPLSRGQYLLGKVLGIWLTLAVFMCANGGLLLLALSLMTGRLWGPILAATGVTAAALVFAWRLKGSGTFLPIVWALALLTLGWVLASEAPDDRRVVVASATLALFEVGIVIGVATLFSAFSSPFLTAIFTLSVFVVGRSADTLAKLPARVFGEQIAALGAGLSRVFPNLMLYVPPRPLLTGESSDVVLSHYLFFCGVQTCLWLTGLLVAATLIFRRRDFV
jgi:Cu-processing system permease protein